MAFQNFADLLADVNRLPTLRDAYLKDREKFWDDYGLSEQEKELLRVGDKKAILSYLGDEYVKAQMINHW